MPERLRPRYQDPSEINGTAASPGIGWQLVVGRSRGCWNQRSEEAGKGTVAPQGAERTRRPRSDHSVRDPEAQRDLLVAQFVQVVQRDYVALVAWQPDKGVEQGRAMPQIHP
jgi:hypothetical protein